MKFQRTYTLTVQPNDVKASPLEFRYPLTLDLEISRNTLASVNKATFTLYNLAENTRRSIFHDRYSNLPIDYRRIQLKAGYESEPNQPVIFQGNVVAAGSYRAGTEWVTKIECFDGGIGVINGQVNITKEAGWDLKSLLKEVVGTMPSVHLNSIGNLKAASTRGISVSGNSWEQVQKLVGDGYAFIDNEGVNLLSESEYLLVDGAIPIITSDSGMLGAPKRQNLLLDVETLFEPRAAVGQLVELQSLETVNNGFYQIRGVEHRGRISGAFDGGVVTKSSLWIGQSRLSQVTPL
jgi:hypothetical protein